MAKFTPWLQAHNLATHLEIALSPHCYQIEIAGSLRRQKPEVGDIEIVCIPKPYDVGLFSTGLATVVNQWPKVKGELPCRYTQRRIPGTEMLLDLFMVTEQTWGYHLALRTGPAEFSQAIVMQLKAEGFRTEDGKVFGRSAEVSIPTEEALFKLLGWPYIAPEHRAESKYKIKIQ